MRARLRPSRCLFFLSLSVSLVSLDVELVSGEMDVVLGPSSVQAGQQSSPPPIARWPDGDDVDLDPLQRVFMHFFRLHLTLPSCSKRRATGFSFKLEAVPGVAARWRWWPESGSKVETHLAAAVDATHLTPRLDARMPFLSVFEDVAFEATSAGRHNVRFAAHLSFLAEDERILGDGS